MKKTPLAYSIGILSLLVSPSLAKEPFIVAHDFHITEGGGFFEKTVHEMSSQEFEFIVQGACFALGGSCSTEAKGAREAFKMLDAEWTASGGNFLISGRVLQHDDGSEEWRGIFDTFEGYEVCSAGLNYGDMSITGESTFNVGIRRSPLLFNGSYYTGLSFYAVVPKHRPTRQWINANFVIRYVPEGTAAQYNCAPDGSYPWLCKGQACNPLTRW